VKLRMMQQRGVQHAAVGTTCCRGDNSIVHGMCFDMIGRAALLLAAAALCTTEAFMLTQSTQLPGFSAKTRMLTDEQRCHCTTMMNKGFGGKPRVPKFKYTGSIRPGAMSPTRPVPAEIMRPEYADTGKVVTNPPRFPWVIEEKTAHDIECMRVAGKIAREVLDAAGRAVRPGVTTDEIDAIVHAETIARDSYPSTLNYHGFTKSCCTSVNEIVCHGIPDSTVLKEGDIVNIDVTCYHKGYHGDCSEMFCVGEVDATSKELIQVTYDAWQAAAAFCKPGRKYQDIGAVIQDYVVRNYC
jgi:Metallopeptidase family M24